MGVSVYIHIFIWVSSQGFIKEVVIFQVSSGKMLVTLRFKDCVFWVSATVLKQK